MALSLGNSHFHYCVTSVLPRKRGKPPLASPYSRPLQTENRTSSTFVWSIFVWSCLVWSGLRQCAYHHSLPCVLDFRNGLVWSGLVCGSVNAALLNCCEKSRHGVSIQTTAVQTQTIW